MTLVDVECRHWGGRQSDYQDAAARELYALGRAIGFPTWVSTTCADDMCLEVSHMEVTAPLTIEYPRRVCVYCGTLGWTKDHLVPRTWSGDAARRYVAVVPACGECNSAISDRHGPSISERRSAAHAHIRRKYKAALAGRDYSPDEMDEFGPSLRAFIENSALVKAEAKARLAWPEDPAYDLRAFQKSGIPDPGNLGLL